MPSTHALTNGAFFLSSSHQGPSITVPIYPRIDGASDLPVVRWKIPGAVAMLFGGPSALDNSLMASEKLGEVLESGLIREALFHDSESDDYEEQKRKKKNFREMRKIFSRITGVHGALGKMKRGYMAAKYGMLQAFAEKYPETFDSLLNVYFRAGSVRNRVVGGATGLIGDVLSGCQLWFQQLLLKDAAERTLKLENSEIPPATLEAMKAKAQERVDHDANKFGLTGHVRGAHVMRKGDL